MWSKIGAIFGFNGVGETALKIINKVAGTDDSPDKQRQFILDYSAATKHQSPVRRFIAVTVTLMFALSWLAWFVLMAIGRFVYDEVLNPATVLAADISAFMQANINDNFAIVMSFYFVMGIVNSARSK